MMAALVSMNMPMMNSAAFTPSRKKPGDCSTALSHTPMASGTPARVIRKANSPALAMMNMITADEITDLRRMVYRSRRLDFAVDHHAHDQRIEHRHGRRFGRREHAAIDAAQDDHRHQQRPACLQVAAAQAQAARRRRSCPSP
jgi:hypothetical protein